MPDPLRVLYVEDWEPDAALVTVALQQAGYSVQSSCVTTAADMQAALRTAQWDVIIADHTLPHFSAPEALKILQHSGHDLPFIIVSGTIDEEQAVAGLKAGAHDFISKGKLARLAPAIERERREAGNRRQQRATTALLREQEANYRLLFDNNPQPMWVYAQDTLAFLEVNAAAIKHYGYTRAEFLNLTLNDIRPAAEQPRFTAAFKRARQPHEHSGPWLHHKRDGSLISVEITSAETHFAGQAARLVLVNDITERLAAEAAYRDSEARFRDVWETTSDALAISDADGVLLSANPAYFRLYGFTPEQLVGRSFTLIFPEEIQAQAIEAYHQIFAAPAPPSVFETVVRRSDGTERIVESWATFLTTDGQRTAMLSTVRDITERKQAEDALRASEDRYRDLIENSQDLICTHDLQGNLLSINPWAAQALGYPAEVLLTMNLREVLAPETQPQLNRYLRIIQRRRAFKGEMTVMTAAGQRRIWAFNNTLRTAGVAQPLVRGMAHDITERKHLEAALRQSEARLRALIDNFPNGSVTVYNRDLRITLVGSAELTQAGLSEAMFLGKHLSEVAPPETVVIAEPALRAVLAGETRHYAAPWNDRYYSVNAAPLYDAQGQVAEVQVVSQNVTEARRAEDALRRERALVTHIMDTSPVSIVLIDRQGHIAFANPRAEAVLGLSRDALTQLTYNAPAWRITDYDGGPFPEAELPFTRVLSTGQPVYAVKHAIEWADGRRVLLSISAAPVFDEAGQVEGVVAAIEDVTELQRAQQAVAQSERRFRALIENGADAITLVQPDGRVSYDSPAAPRMLGYAADEWLERSVFEIIHPDDSGLIRQVLQQLQDNPAAPATARWRVKHKDGSWRWLEGVAANLLADPSVRAIVVNYRDITERRLAEDQIQRQFEYLNALREIDRAISASFDLNISLKLLLAQVVAQLGVPAATVLVFNAVTQALELAAERGFRSKLAELTTWHMGEGYAGRAALERQTVHIPNLAQQQDNPRLRQALAAEAFTGYYAVPLVAKGQVRGVLEVFQRAAPGAAPDSEWLDFLHTLAGQAAIAIDNAALLGGLQRSNAELAQAYDATIAGWSRALDLRDHETEGHGEALSDLTVALGRAMGLSEDELTQLRRGALLHDIGKIAMPDSILFKPGALTDEEWAIMRQHPRRALELLAPIAFLGPALDIPYCHHEKWDGTGYPRGLAGEQIPLAARLFAVVDVWDALRANRPYRPAWPDHQIFAHLRALAGTHFDPRAVQVFFEIIR